MFSGRALQVIYPDLHRNPVRHYVVSTLFGKSPDFFLGFFSLTIVAWFSQVKVKFFL